MDELLSMLTRLTDETPSLLSCAPSVSMHLDRFTRDVVIQVRWSPTGRSTSGYEYRIARTAIHNAVDAEQCIDRYLSACRLHVSLAESGAAGSQHA